MKAARFLMTVLSAIFTNLILFGLYRIASEAGGFPSPKQLGMQGVYMAVQFAVCVGIFFGIRKLSLRAFKPEKFLLFYSVISFVFLIIVISMGLRMTKQLKSHTGPLYINAWDVVITRDAKRPVVNHPAV